MIYIGEQTDNLYNLQEGDLYVYGSTVYVKLDDATGLDISTGCIEIVERWVSAFGRYKIQWLDEPKETKFHYLSIGTIFAYDDDWYIKTATNEAINLDWKCTEEFDSTKEEVTTGDVRIVKY